MVKTRCRWRNNNENRQPEHVIGHAPVIALPPEPITMVGVQAMLAEHMEEAKKLIQGGKKKAMTPIVEPVLNEV